jgi:hypothetical protein
VECVKNMPLYMVCCPIEIFGSPKLVTSISLGIIEKNKTLYIYIIYEGRLFVCFVLFMLIKSIELGCLRSHSWSVWKALDEEGCMGLVP